MVKSSNSNLLEQRLSINKSTELKEPGIITNGYQNEHSNLKEYYIQITNLPNIQNITKSSSTIFMTTLKQIIILFFL